MLCSHVNVWTFAQHLNRNDVYMHSVSLISRPNTQASTDTRWTSRAISQISVAQLLLFALSINSTFFADLYTQPRIPHISLPNDYSGRWNLQTKILSSLCFASHFTKSQKYFKNKIPSTSNCYKIHKSCKTFTVLNHSFYFDRHKTLHTFYSVMRNISPM